MKKIVRYYASKGVIPFMNSVMLFPVDHPFEHNVSNTCEAVTSPVVSWDKDTGIIETQNTIYKPDLEK